MLPGLGFLALLVIAAHLDKGRLQQRSKSCLLSSPPKKKSNNGTDVNAGQIPQLLFRVVAPEPTVSK